MSSHHFKSNRLQRRSKALVVRKNLQPKYIKALDKRPSISQNVMAWLVLLPQLAAIANDLREHALLNAGLQKLCTLTTVDARGCVLLVSKL